MMLSVRTYKVRKSDGNAERKTYRFAGFDDSTLLEGNTFEQRFNEAFDCIKEEINQDRKNNDMTKYEPIVICDVFLS